MNNNNTLWIQPEEPDLTDHFDSLPDSIILLIFNRILDVKSLGRCVVVSRRFHSLVPQVDNAVVRVDCVISDDQSPPATSDKPRHPFSSLLRGFFSNLFKPITHFITPNYNSSSNKRFSSEHNDSVVTHHSPTQVLKNFNELKVLRIELPSGELGIDEGVLLKWKAGFGSTLDDCVILGASSVVYEENYENNNNNNMDCCSGHNINNNNNNNNNNVDVVESDNGSIPESFYTNGGLKLRVVWTISSLIAASARHYLLQPIIAEHETLESLVLADADGQGVLCMDKGQLEELRVKPLSASSASKRTLVPALNMRLWYAPRLELGDGIVLKGATLVAIRPSEGGKKEVGAEGSWVGEAFEEPFGTAARMLVKRRTYCLEMNSF